MKECCENCKWWRRGEFFSEAMRRYSETVGDCVFNAPKSGSVEKRWPRVEKTDYCGQFKQKDAE